MTLDEEKPQANEEIPREETLPGVIQSNPAPAEFYQQTKERSAAWVAQALVCIFGGVLAVSLVCGFLIIAYHPPPPLSGGTSTTETIVSLEVIPLLQAIGTFASTVFGPLLAFVLGYYFGERKQA